MLRSADFTDSFGCRFQMRKKAEKQETALPPKQQIKPKETGQIQRESLAIDLDANCTAEVISLLKIFRTERNKMYQLLRVESGGNLVKIQHLGRIRWYLLTSADYGFADIFSNVSDTFFNDLKIFS